jgi:CRISPR-associated protein Csy1
MLDPAIEGFLNERKEVWLKKKINSKTSDEEKVEFEQQADEDFSLAVWLSNAAKRAWQLSLASHPSTFSHPRAKTTNIIAESTFAKDGLLRSGNVATVLDVYGNAAALDVYAFLNLKMEDGQTILHHLESKSLFIKEQLDISETPFLEIENGLLAIKYGDNSTVKTSNKVKQVYFPVDSVIKYHLLSILTPADIMYKLKGRIRDLHFSESTKEARKAKSENNVHETGFSEVFGLSVIGYGGAQPQNISVLNFQNRGEAYLLSSVPPGLSDRRIQPPRVDFFTNSLWPKLFQDDFQKFHEQLVADANNVHVRRRRDYHIRAIIYQVVDRLWLIRTLESGWSESDNYQRLPGYQKIWLDQAYEKTREDDLTWFDTVQKELARWFASTYRKLLDTKALTLGDEQLPHIRKIISECEGGLL